MPVEAQQAKSKDMLTRTFKAANNLNARERNLYICIEAIKSIREQYLSDHMEEGKKEEEKKVESRYMQIVEEERDLYRIPKNLDTDILRKEKMFGEKARFMPEKRLEALPTE